MTENKIQSPFAYKHFAVGFSCPECGRAMVTDEAAMWCMNKNCGAFALAFDMDWKSK